MGQAALDTAYWSVVSAQTPDSRAARRARAESGAGGADGGTGTGVDGGPDGPKPRSRARKVTKWVLFSLLSLVALGAVAVAIAYATIQSPAPNDLANAQASIVYYDDGKTELARLSDAQGNRESVPLSKVPDHVQKAVLAAEDRDFYTNPGFSPTGIARSVWQALRGADVQGGGSTITQQYVKNYFLTSDRSLTRKFKEIIISVKIDQQQGKDQILENYLNTIYYGRGAYGIQTASKAYFNKDVSQLSVAEGATLAAIVNAPSLYDPALGDKQKANLKTRVTYVLDGMVAEGWLSQADRDKVTGPADTVPPANNTAIAGPNGYIVDAVRKELGSTLKLSDSDIDRGGLRITTTINKASQDAAVASVQKYLPKEAPDVQAGLTSIKPGDGAIVAMYGGADFQKRQLNSSTDAIMQAGSTFKPFALIAGLQQGISTKTQFNGNSPITVGNVKVPNEFNQSFGMIDLRRATAKSVNTVFVGLNNKVGPANTKNAAIAAGMPEKTAGLDDTLTNVLGTASPHVVDVASAYATIAAQGQKATPYLVAAVTSETTDIDYKVNKQTDRGVRRRRRGRHHRRAPAGDGLRRHRRSRRRPRPADRRQDRYLRRAQVGLVHRVRPAAGHLGRHVPRRQRRPAAAGQHPGPQRQRGRRQQPPAVDVARLHEGGHPGHGGPAVPQAGRHRRQRGDDDEHAVDDHDHRPVDDHDDAAADLDDDRAAVDDDDHRAAVDHDDEDPGRRPSRRPRRRHPTPARRLPA